jgi:hypothetical protein
MIDMSWIDIMSKRNKSELKESKLVRGAKAELKQLRNKRLDNDCIVSEIHELRSDIKNRVKGFKAKMKMECENNSRRWK